MAPPQPAARRYARAMTESRISRRVGAITPSATLAITAKAQELRAAGESVIGFGAGEPDFSTPDYIVEAAAAACRDPKNHKYSPAGGLPELKEAIAAKTAPRLGPGGGAVAGAGEQRGASTPSSTPCPPSSTPATRCCCRPRTGSPTPSPSPSPAG